jgi:drug/metabolite transporter (DMT)-like permease
VNAGQGAHAIEKGQQEKKEGARAIDSRQKLIERADIIAGRGEDSVLHGRETSEPASLSKPVPFFRQTLLAIYVRTHQSLGSFTCYESFTNVLRQPVHWQVVLTGGIVLLIAVCLIFAKLMQGPDSKKMLMIIFLCVAYNCVSAVLIRTNKGLMHHDGFPYPLTLVSTQMLTCWLLSSCLRLCVPALFPSLEHVDVTWSFGLKLLAIGTLFATSVVFSTAAYQYLSVPFLQVMKHCNVVLIYAFSLLCGLDTLTRCSSVLLLMTVLGTVMNVEGELDFQLFGFLIQAVSSCAEAGKVVLQGVLMSGSLKLDPLTLVLFMAPACLCAIMVPLISMEANSVMLSHYMQNVPMILCSSMLAFALNVLVACCIKELSPTGYIMMGTLKDVVIVGASTIILGDTFTVLQVIGGLLSLVAILSYSLYRKNIDCFPEDALFTGAKRVFQRLSNLSPEPDCQ